MYLAIERAEGAGSVDRARAAARAAGARFSNAESMLWLSDFLNAAVRRRDSRRENGVTYGVENEHKTAGQTAENRRDSRTAVGLTRNKGIVPSTPIAVPSALPAPPAQAGSKSNPQPPRPMKLPLDAQVQDARRAILAAMWELLARTPFSASISKTEWGRRNSRVALDLATKGITPERIVAAYHAAEKRMGTPPRTLQVVQDQLGRMALPDAQRPNNKPSGSRPTQYQRCGACDSFKPERDLRTDPHFPRPICPDCVRKLPAA